MKQPIHRITVKTASTDFDIRGTAPFVEEMIEAYIRIFTTYYGYHPFEKHGGVSTQFSVSEPEPPKLTVVHDRDKT